MDKDKFIEILCRLVGRQTYQCYKEKNFKKDLRTQKRDLLALAKALDIKLNEGEIYDMFVRFNLWDIDRKFLCQTLSLNKVEAQLDS